MPKVEILGLRQENSKTFNLGGSKRQWQGSIGAIHYKDNYADKSEQWKDIDLNWEGDRITKAPFEMTLDGNKVTIRNKKTEEISTIEPLKIGGKGIPIQAWEKSKGLAKAGNLEVKVENGHVRFIRILQSSSDPIEAKFKVKGNFRVYARDIDGELPVETTSKNGVLTERLKPDRTVKYPVRIDPTWAISASSDDCVVTYDINGSTWVFELLTQVNFQAGYHAVDDWADFGSAGRFLNVTIPQGSTIHTAKLTLHCRSSRDETTVNTRITGEDVDDAATFDDLADYQARRGTVVGGANDNNITTAQVDWDAIAAWTANTDYDSPEIKTIIQEIVDRGGWASGQAMVIFWDDHDGRGDSSAYHFRVAESWDGDSNNPPELVITYDVAVTPSTLALILTTYIPTIAISDHQLVTPTTLALILTEYAPTVLTPRLVTPSTLALSLTSYTPSAIIGFIITPTTLALILTSYAPTVLTPRLVTPLTLALILTIFAPTASLRRFRALASMTGRATASMTGRTLASMTGRVIRTPTRTRR